MTDRPVFYYKNDPISEIKAGGLLFYYPNKKTNDIDFLMIKSRGYFEDIGGRTDKVDKTANSTIAREVEEESNKIFKKKYILNVIKKETPLYTKPSKYLLYICKLEDKYENLDPIVFGDKEFHDDIFRTMEWIPYTKLKKKKFRETLNFRLKFKEFFSTIQSIYKKHYKDSTISDVSESEDESDDNTNSSESKIINYGIVDDDSTEFESNCKYEFI
jgi:hypothetical protein